MRILHVTDFFPPVRGGLEGHVDDIAAAQVAAGHQVHVATLTPRPSPADPEVSTHVVRAASTRLLPHAEADRPFHPPLPDPRARRDLQRILEHVRPDIVHAHSWLGVSLPRRAVPVVLTAHDYALICQLHTLLRPDGTACDGPRLGACAACGRSTHGTAKSALLAAGTAAGQRLWSLDAVLTLSDHVARTLRPHVDVPMHTYGGLLAPSVAPRPTDGLPDEPFVLAAGDPGRHKGLDVLLDAWRLGVDAPLVVASTKPVGRSLPTGVRVVHFDRAEMAWAWSKATVAVVPSLWPEPYGMVAMEALAAGTPVVASRIGALPELVRDGVDGVLVPPGDPAALAAAVGGVLADAAGRRSMATAARAGATRFEPSTVIARLDAAYDAVLGRVAVAR